MREVPLGDSLYFKGRAENETELNGTRPGSGQFWRNKSLHSFRRVTDQAIPGFLSWVAAGQGSTEEDSALLGGRTTKLRTKSVGTRAFDSFRGPRAAFRV